MKLNTHSEQGSSSVRSDKQTFAKWMNNIPMACLEVSKNLYRVKTVFKTHKTVYITVRHCKFILIKIRSQLFIFFFEKEHQNDKVSWYLAYFTVFHFKFCPFFSLNIANNKPNHTNLKPHHCKSKVQGYPLGIICIIHELILTKPS